MSPVRGWIVAGVLLASALAAGCGPAGRSHNIRQVASYYHVRPGDSLYTIAWRYNLDVRDLMGWNRLEPPYTIHPGQRLRLSPPPGYRPRLARKPVSAPPARSASAPRPNVPTASPAPSRPAAVHRQPTPPPVAKETASPRPRPATAPANEKKPPAPPVAKRRLSWRWPLHGQVVRRFNARLPGHQGIRIRGRNGDAVRAVEAGKVVYSGNGLKGYRELIIIQHSADYLSAYAQNRRRLVAEGDQVKRGQRIAELGDPHTNAPELHFELRYRGKPVDPLRYLRR